MGWRIVLHVMRVWRDDRATTLAEYALMSAIIGLAMLAGVAVLRSHAGGELSATANGWLSVALTPP